MRVSDRREWVGEGLMQRGAPKSGWGGNRPVRPVDRRPSQGAPGKPSLQKKQTVSGVNRSGAAEPTARSSGAAKPSEKSSGSAKSSENSGCLGWLILFAIICALAAMCDDDTDDEDATGQPTSVATETSSAPPPDPRVMPVFVGSVVSVSRAGLSIQSDSHRLWVKWARLNIGGLCGNEVSSAMDTRLRELVPIGASVTVVRDPVGFGPASQSEYGYIHLAAPGQQATMQPAGVSINQQIVAEGNAAIYPEIDRSQNAAPVGAQVGANRAVLAADYVAAFDGLVAANIAAWDSRLGALGLCQDRLEREKADRIRWWGVDEKPGTDDDPSRHVPAIGGSGSGNGGGGEDGWFCRRRWWC